MNAVDDLDAAVIRPYFPYYDTRLHNVAPRFTNMRWGRRCMARSKETWLWVKAPLVRSSLRSHL